MKVVLKESAADATNVRGWLRSGQEYVVLAVELLGRGKSAFRIESENSGTPSLFEANLFEIIDAAVSPSWVAVQLEDLPLQFMPEPWARDGFWDDYFDGSRQARDEYLQARDEIASSAADKA